MGLGDFVASQLIDVIEYSETSSQEIIHKFIRPGDEIKQGANVIVREGQVAIFVKHGQLADILNPGTHKLNTANLPILSTLGALPFGFNSPIKSDLYFVATRQFIDNKWGTKNPIPVRDPEFNMVRIRAFGTYSFRIVDAALFMREIFGSLAKTTTQDIVSYLNGIIGEAMAEAVANVGMPVLDLATNYRSLGSKVAEVANGAVSGFGVSFVNVVVENISLPDEVEKLIDEQSGIGMASGNMDTFMQYQTARAMRDAAQQEGGLAGLGAGMALGNTMATQISDTQSPQPSQSSSDDKVTRLRNIKALLDEGILTQEEFDAKKKEILGL